MNLRIVLRVLGVACWAAATAGFYLTAYLNRNHQPPELHWATFPNVLTSVALVFAGIGCQFMASEVKR